MAPPVLWYLPIIYTTSCIFQENIPLKRNFFKPGILEQALVFGEQSLPEIIEDSRIATANLRTSHESAEINACSVVETKAKTPTSTIAPSTSKDMEEYPDDWKSRLRLHVRRIYEKCGHNLTEAAKLIQISRNTAKKYLDS